MSASSDAEIQPFEPKPFNWHDLPRDSWKAFFCVHALGQYAKEHGYDAGIPWDTTAMTIKLFIDDVPVDFDVFLDRLEKGYDDSVDRAAKEKLQEAMNDIIDKMYEAADDVAHALRDKAREAGLRIYDED